MAETTNDLASDTGIGALLRASRMRIGEDLRDVAGMLRIRYPYLEAIEEGRFSDLPGQAYAVGFVRAYADHLGLDGEEVVRRFKEEATGGGKSRTDLRFPTPVTEASVPGGAIVFIGLLVALLAYGGWYVSTSDENYFADLIEPIPERLSALISRDDEAPEAVAGQETALETAPSTGPSTVPVSEAAAPAEPAPAKKESAAPQPPETPVSPPTDAAASTPSEAPAVATPEPAVQAAETPASESSPAAEAEAATNTASISDAVPAADAPKPATQPTEDTNQEPTPTPTATETPTAAASASASPSATTTQASSAVAQGAAEPGASPPPAPAPSAVTAVPVETAAASEPPSAASATEAVVGATPTPTPAPVPETDEAATPSENETTVAAADAVPAEEPAPAAEETAPSTSRVLVRAKSNSWIQVQDDFSNEMLVTRLLKAGEEYHVPDKFGLRLLTGNAGALEILVDGKPVPPIGEEGAVRRGVQLDPALLKAGQAVSE